LSIFAICNPVNMDRVDRAIAEEFEKLLRDGVQADELAEAKKSYLGQEKVHRANDTFLAASLDEELFNDRTFAYYADLENKIAALTPEDVTAAIRKHFDPKRLVIIHAGDFKKQARGKAPSAAPKNE